MPKIMVQVKVRQPGERADAIVREVRKAGLPLMDPLNTGAWLADVEAADVTEAHAAVERRLDVGWPDWREYLSVPAAA